ncbi:MAG: uracil-DNA glycosylase family protein [Armatimonadota bacterium]|nr:uracil-DNA glycosylase family protein [Armatimonadota bacterium]
MHGCTYAFGALGAQKAYTQDAKLPAGSPLVLVGEGPGAVEDSTGRRFVGRAGQLLRQLLREEAGVDPEAVYISNAVKCRSWAQDGDRRKDVAPPSPPSRPATCGCDGRSSSCHQPPSPSPEQSGATTCSACASATYTVPL